MIGTCGRDGLVDIFYPTRLQVSAQRAYSKVALRGIRIAESRVRFPVSPQK